MANDLQATMAPPRSQPEPVRISGGDAASRDWFPLLALLFFFVLCAIRMRSYIYPGRIWAEEGFNFYTDFSHLGLLDCLGYLFNNHLEFATNAILWLATRVPLYYAPLVTTYLGLLVQALPVFLLAAYGRELGLSRVRLLIVLFAMASIPQAEEIWANSITLHFHLPLAVGLILILDTGGGFRRNLFRVLLALAGLSGIPPNFLAPAFLAKAMLRKDRESWIQFAILAATCGLQLYVILTSQAEMNRDIVITPVVFWLSVLMQQMVSPILGSFIGHHVSPILRETLNGTPYAILFALACSVPFALFFRRLLAGRNGMLILFTAASFFLAACNMTASLGSERIYMISSWAGGRYFYASNIMLLISLLLVFKSVRSRLLLIPLVLMLLTNVVELADSKFTGPPWPQEYRAAVSSGAQEINIWPHGWTMANPLVPNP